MQNPPFFDNESLIDIKDISRLAIVAGLDDKNIKLLSSMISLPSSEAHQDAPYLSIDYLAAELGIGQTAVRNRLKALTVGGLVEHSKIKIDTSRRPVSLFRPALPDAAKMLAALTKNDAFAELPVNQNVTQMSVADIAHFAKSGSPHTIDNLLCTILFTALPPSKKLTTEVISTNINWFGYSIPVIARPRKDKPLAKLGDVLYYIMLLTYLNEYIKNYGLPPEVHATSTWTVPVSGILGARYVAMDNDKGHKKYRGGSKVETCINALQRIADTQFELLKLPEQILKRYGWEAGQQNYNPLSNFGVYYEKKNVNSKAVITFQLPAIIQSALIHNRATLFEISPNAVRYGEDFLLAMHLWAKRRLGSKILSHLATHREAHREIAPTLTFGGFMRKMTGAFNRFQARMEGKAAAGIVSLDEYRYYVAECEHTDESKKTLEKAKMNFFGYVFTYSENHLNVTRDPADPYTGILLGKASFSNRKLEHTFDDLEDEGQGITDNAQVSHKSVIEGVYEEVTGEGS